MQSVLGGYEVYGTNRVNGEGYSQGAYQLKPSGFGSHSSSSSALSAADAIDQMKNFNFVGTPVTVVGKTQY